jgi:hypothetical protein
MQSLNRPQVWLEHIESWQQELVELSYSLLAREQELSAHAEYKPLSDYAFIVFPMAKGYEGFLKQYLLDQKLIDMPTYQSRRFRIGRALNPDVPQNQRDTFWLYDDVAHLCGEEVAKELWQVWLECRNHLFHYFPNQEYSVTLHQAAEHLDIMSHAMTAAYECSLK